AQYRAVMLIFVRAKRRFSVHLRPEDVHDAMDGVELAALADTLQRLVEWGNLRADPDTSRVTTVEDFHRARYLYQLTDRGEAVEVAVAAFDEALGRRGSLQAVALVDIATQLRALREYQSDPDPAKVHLALRILVDRFTDLAGNAQAFMGSLQRTIDLHDVDIEVFRAYKDRLIEYLERFIKDLISTGSEIALLIEEIEHAGVDRLLDLAAGREAEDAAPGGDADTDDPRAREFAIGRVRWQERWRGFRGWFRSEGQHPSQAMLLRSQARSAIPALLRVVATLNERRSGRSDRSADFRALARWFAQAPEPADTHRLWRAAFGLSSARHLSTTDELADQHVRGDTAWANAPRLPISPQLRKTGSFERRGKPNRVIERHLQRRYLAERAEREAAETAAARTALATTHPTRLADLGMLDPAAFRLFLALLGEALGARTPGTDSVYTSTSDGTMSIRLTALAEAATAQLRTEHGLFRGPDHLIEIADLTATEELEASA
ncbi:MAG: TIGR02677 family protein, partial [Sciscionella sp.]